MSELDEWFPRADNGAPPEPNTDPGIIDGARYDRRKSAHRKSTAKNLERIGEGLTHDVLEKFGVTLRKIPLLPGYYGYISVDVDFQGAYQGRPLKVEAKTWWVARKSFALSRFSENERGYMRRGLNEGWQCWVSIALLDGEPTRRACNTLYVLSWEDWLNIESQLAARAAGNFKGRSLRAGDIDLLSGYEVRRVKRQWVVAERHPLLGEAQ